MVEHALPEAALAAEAVLAGEATQDCHLMTQGSPHFNKARVHSCSLLCAECKCTALAGSLCQACTSFFVFTANGMHEQLFAIASGTADI